MINSNACFAYFNKIRGILGVDITARLIGQWLSERLGQPFVIEDRPAGALVLAAAALGAVLATAVRQAIRP